MPRGRKPLPTAMHEMNGSYIKNPQRRPKNEPKAPKEAPTCPRYLDRLAKNEWRHACGLLAEMGVLSAADKSALAIYCETYSEWRKAVDMCKQYGAWQVTKNARGDIETKRHEWDRVRERTADACRRWLTEFGLTPSARARLQVEKETKDEFDAFIDRFTTN